MSMIKKTVSIQYALFSTLFVFIATAAANTEISYIYGTGNRLIRQVTDTQDRDNDGISNTIEMQTCTDPDDSDSDDDGIIDGDEDLNHNGIQDDGETDPCNADSDGDGVQDGTETGLTLNDIGPDTDQNIFQQDTDSSTTTDPLNPDTDYDGYTDGQEDLNGDGGFTADTDESDPFIRETVFDSNSHIITNKYFKMQQGDVLIYAGTGTFEDSRLTVSAVGTEVIDEVNCLTAEIRTSDENPDVWQLSLWLAQDMNKNVWLFKIADIYGNTTILFSQENAVLQMPANPVPGQIFGRLGSGYAEVLDKGVSSPRTLASEGGVYNNCLKISQINTDGDEYIKYMAAGIGSVVEEWNINGQENGWILTQAGQNQVSISLYVMQSSGETAGGNYRIKHTAGQPLISYSDISIGEVQTDNPVSGVKTYLITDFNKDGDVDGLDLHNLISEFGRECADICLYDLNGDNAVDENDLAIFANDFGKVYQPGEIDSQDTAHGNIARGGSIHVGFWPAVSAWSDTDSDDDGIPDDMEDSNNNGIVDPGETDPFNPDTDGDGVQDGTESGYTLNDIGPDTDLNIFQPDNNPGTTTDPALYDNDIGENPNNNSEPEEIVMQNAISGSNENAYSVHYTLIQTVGQPLISTNPSDQQKAGVWHTVDF